MAFLLPKFGFSAEINSSSSSSCDWYLKRDKRPDPKFWTTLTLPSPTSSIQKSLRIECIQTQANINYCITFLVEVKNVKALFPQLKAGASIIGKSPSFVPEINTSPAWR